MTRFTPSRLPLRAALLAAPALLLLAAAPARAQAPQPAAPGHSMPGHSMPGQPTPGHGAHGAAGGTAHDMAEMMRQMQPQPGDSPFVRDFKAAHMKMMRDMHHALTGTPDQVFVRGMIPHHQGAIDMARVQLQHGTNPEMRRLAEKIIEDQEREIAEMRAWQEKNGR